MKFSTYVENRMTNYLNESANYHSILTKHGFQKTSSREEDGTKLRVYTHKTKPTHSIWLQSPGSLGSTTWGHNKDNNEEDCDSGPDTLKRHLEKHFPVKK